MIGDEQQLLQSSGLYGDGGDVRWIWRVSIREWVRCWFWCENDWSSMLGYHRNGLILHFQLRYSILVVSLVLGVVPAQHVHVVGTRFPTFFRIWLWCPCISWGSWWFPGIFWHLLFPKCTLNLNSAGKHLLVQSRENKTLDIDNLYSLFTSYIYPHLLDSHAYIIFLLSF